MKKLLLFIISILILLPIGVGCQKEGRKLKVKDGDNIVFAKKGYKSPFTILYDMGSKDADLISSIAKEITRVYGDTLPEEDSYLLPKQSPYEIIVNALERTECESLYNTLADGEYAIKTIITDTKTSIVIAYKGDTARMMAVGGFLYKYVLGDTKQAAVPADLNIFEKAKSPIIESGVPALRDPCILQESGIYYMYGTGWTCYTNSTGKLDGTWEGPFSVVALPEGHEADTDYWAPEVHKYGEYYYMFTTYHSSVTNHHGCTILRADNPLGPFEEITNGQITPKDWDCIDGTLYIDENNQPWMVFVHEWTSMPDKIGSFCAAKLSDDFTKFISEPIELFKARDTSWANAGVTDGCWMYRTAEGELLMVWSNFDKYGYNVAIARSKSGNILGKWKHDERQLYSWCYTGEYDGGHGMIFTDTDGQMYLSMHSPNTKTNNRGEMPVFLKIREENNTLVWDY